MCGGKGDEVLADNRLPAGHAVKVARHIAAVPQFQFLTGGAIRLIDRHAAVSHSLGHLFRHVGFRQAHMGVGGFVDLSLVICHTSIGLRSWPLHFWHVGIRSAMLSHRATSRH